jgi:amidohydrolase family protein
MKRSRRKVAMSLTLACAGFLMATTAHPRLEGQTATGAAKSPAGTKLVPALSPYIEVHSHFDEHDAEGTVRSALRALGRQNTAKIYLLIPPMTFDDPGVYDAEVILPAAKKYPDQLGVLGGGGSLNAMIQQSVRSGDAGPEIQKKFKDRAEQLLREGVAGFGELTAEHIKSITPYQYAPADHPLFLLLDDIAAQHGVPIELHMEAVPKTMLLPSDLKSPPNPRELHENIPAFERLLGHNPRAKILWAHAGTDLTGYRTPDLCRRLLRAHPNLYIEIKADPDNIGKNFPMENGKIKPEWLQLFQELPDRFVIGSDQHYPEPDGPQQRWQTVVLLFNQLPADVRRKIGMENAQRIFAASPAASSRSAAKQ